MVERSVVYVLGPLTPRSPLPEAGRGEGTLRVASCELRVVSTLG